MKRNEFFSELLNLALRSKTAEFLEKFADDKKRPPGAVSEPLFATLCTGCDACMIACPKNILIIDDLEKRLPFLEDRAPCLGCSAPCRSACQTGALQP